MIDWSTLGAILGVLGAVSAAIYGYFKNRSQSKLESFASIMAESKKFREEIRSELNSAKNKIEDLTQQVKIYEKRIAELEKQLKEAVNPPAWLYYNTQKPLKVFEIESIIKRHIINKSDEILAIEDDPFMERFLDGIETDNHWNIMRSRSGKSAIDYLKLHTPKLILIDLVVPVGDVFEAINAVRESKDLSNIPIVVITSTNLKEVDRIFIHSKINESVITA